MSVIDLDDFPSYPCNCSEFEKAIFRRFIVTSIVEIKSFV